MFTRMISLRYRWDCDIFWSTRRVAALGEPQVRRALGRGFLRSKVLWALGSRVRDAKESISKLAWQVLGEHGASALGFKSPTERIIQAEMQLLRAVKASSFPPFLFFL